MKKLQLLLVSVAMLSIFSCSDDDDDTLGVWYRRSDFDGRAREDAAGFVIGNRGYLCGGYRGKDQREKDCWEYNIDNDWWTRCNSPEWRCRIRSRLERICDHRIHRI